MGPAGAVIRLVLTVASLVPFLVTPANITRYSIYGQRLVLMGRGSGSLIVKKSISKLGGVPAGFVIGQTLYPKRQNDRRFIKKAYLKSAVPYNRFGRFYRRSTYRRYGRYARPSYRRRY